MDFKIDSGGLWDLYELLSAAIDNLSINIEKIYSGITAMEEGWQGQSYNDFKEKAESYRPALDAMVDAYKAFRAFVFTKILSEDVNNKLKVSISDAYNSLEGEK